MGNTHIIRSLDKRSDIRFVHDLRSNEEDAIDICQRTIPGFGSGKIEFDDLFLAITREELDTNGTEAEQ